MIQSKWFFRQIAPLFFFLLLLSITGCAVIPHKLGPFPEKQVIVTDGKGDMLKPLGNISRDKNLYSSILELKHPIRCNQDKKDYLKKSAEEIARQLGAGKDVVIYLHGGMNVQVKALKRAQDLLNYAKEQKQDAPYFVFINWQSSLYSSYRDRLFAIREGKDYRTYDGTTSLFKELPNDLVGLFFYLPADLLTGVARSPLSLERAFVNTHWFSLDNEINQAKKRLSTGWFKTHVTQIEDDFPYSWRILSNNLMVPFRIVTIPLVDALGKHAWDVMQRRTTILFSRDNNSDSTITEKGPLQIFGEMLKSALNDSSQKHVTGKRGKLLLVGHSMGTIIASEFLRRFPEIPFDDIVFMAAACSIRDLDESVFPYLAHPKNRESEFYNLMLHPYAETREAHALGISPGGSLLLYIDQGFEQPDTMLDRTAGRYTNIGLNANYLFNRMQQYEPQTDISQRIHFKVFPYRDDYLSPSENIPMTHGAFGDFHFWEENFWKEEGSPQIYPRWTEERNKETAQ